MTKAIQADAERTVFLSIAEARELPNMLGRICPAMLKAHGYYAATVGGVKTLFVRKEQRS